MKKSLIFLPLLISLFLLSCTDYLETQKDSIEQNQNYITITGTLLSELTSTAVSRSAFPEINITDYTTEIYYYKTSDSEADKILCATTDNSSFEFAIPSLGEYYLVAESYLTSDSNKKIVLQTNTPRLISLTEQSPYTNNVTLVVNLLVTDSFPDDGSISLPVHADSSITTCIAAYKLNESVSEETITFVPNAESFSVENITPGVYTVVFNFYDGTSNLVYQCEEEISVYSNMTTNTWVNNGNAEYFKTEDSKTIMFISQECLNNFLLTEFYVGAASNDITPDDTNSGTYFSPFATLVHAVEIIKSLPSTQTYTINILNNCTVTSSASSGSVLELKGNILIKGDTTELFVDCNQEIPFISIPLGSNITIRNLTINGLINGENDEKVFCNNSSGIINNGSLVLQNCTVMNFTNTDCGAIQNQDGSLILINTKIQNNTSEKNGSGIGITGGTCTFMSGEICNNIIKNGNNAETGGGVYVNGGTFIMEGGNITGNVSRTDVQNASEVYINKGTFRMTSGYIQVKGNEDSNKRAIGVYVGSHSDAVFKVSGSSYIYIGGGNNTDCVFLSSGKTITLTDDMTCRAADGTKYSIENPCMKISLPESDYSDDTAVISASSSELIKNNYSKFAMKDSDYKIIQANTNDTTAVLQKKPDGD